eukprot:1192947-Prorocentrum_minimum.AAC.7
MDSPPRQSGLIGPTESKVARSGRPRYATLLLASARCPSRTHHSPALAPRSSLSSRSDSEISAARRTPPLTTTSPTWRAPGAPHPHPHPWNKSTRPANKSW